MLKVCLTGATGFIGRNLLKNLQENEDLEVIALSRQITPAIDNAKKGNTTWRRCNGFSLLDAEKATAGADILIYLIHSMLPATSLSQGTFSDFDLYLADNFARAAKTNGIKKIIYLSGIIPDDKKKLSAHLLSRQEVERTLSQYGNDLTVLRASLIIGLHGSSFRILERLIKRLPVLICPTWTLSKTQPIDLKDVLASLEYCLQNHQTLEKTYDIGGPDVITYRKMLMETSKVLHRKRKFVNIPFFSLGLSKLWISVLTSTPRNLVYPLVDSLKHQMTVNPEQQLLLQDYQYISFSDSLKKGVSSDSGNWMRIVINYNANINLRWLENVTSIQKIKLTKKTNGEVIAHEYFKWLPSFLRPFIRVTVKQDFVYFNLLGSVNLLKLEKSNKRSDATRVVYYILDGLLARDLTLNGRLEFRWIESSNCIIIALLDYRPALPWFIYKYTQALVHVFVMKRFAQYLKSNF